MIGAAGQRLEVAVRPLEHPQPEWRSRMSHEDDNDSKLPEAEKPTSHVDKLTQQILDDRKRHTKRPAHAAATTCFICERAYRPQSIDDEGSTRFCSVNCRNAWDTGFPPGAENPGLHPEL